MNKQEIINKAASFVETAEENQWKTSRIFEAPIFGFGAATDEQFFRLKDPSAIGEHYLLPQEWLPEANTVISFFLPFTEEVKKGNQKDTTWPSEAWLYGRMEGQAFVNNLCRYLSSELIKAGYKSLVPSLDKRFWANPGLPAALSNSLENEGSPKLFTSNWSERHTAFVCGLGTFGLSKGLITQKGMAGRFGSIITDLVLNPEERGYRDIYEYCSRCGACIEKCPVRAISLDTGKNHTLCSDFLDKTAEIYKPRYGCGKCQVGVPCERALPKK